MEKILTRHLCGRGLQNVIHKFEQHYLKYNNMFTTQESVSIIYEAFL